MAGAKCPLFVRERQHCPSTRFPRIPIGPFCSKMRAVFTQKVSGGREELPSWCKSRTRLQGQPSLLHFSDGGSFYVGGDAAKRQWSSVRIDSQDPLARDHPSVIMGHHVDCDVQGC